MCHLINFKLIKKNFITFQNFSQILEKITFFNYYKNFNQIYKLHINTKQLQIYNICCKFKKKFLILIYHPIILIFF